MLAEALYSARKECVISKVMVVALHDDVCVEVSLAQVDLVAGLDSLAALAAECFEEIWVNLGVRRW